MVWDCIYRRLRRRLRSGMGMIEQHDSNFYASRGSRFLAIGCLAFVVACGGSSTGVVPGSWSSIVHGVVTNEQGAPVAGARISSRALVPDCTTGSVVGAGSPTLAVTDGLGQYTQRVVSERPDAAQCVEVTVSYNSMPDVIGFAEDARFKLTSEASLPFDSSRVDIRLP